MLTSHLLGGGVLAPVAGDAPSFSALRLFEEAPTCLGAVWGRNLCSMCAQTFDERLHSEAQLSMRALVLVLLSGRDSVRLSAACKREGLNKATLGRACHWGLCCTGALFREGLPLRLPERPCCREVMLPQDLRSSLLAAKQAHVDPTPEEESLNSARRC